MKGMVFAGCSFTWGQGLYFYSDLNHIPKFEDWVYDYKLMTHALTRFKDTIRFPRLVANHFKTFDVCKATNGGSDLTSVLFLKKIFDEYEEPVNDGGHVKSSHWLSQENYYFDDIEYVIFQTTQTYRSRYPFTYKDEQYFIYPLPELNGLQKVSKIFNGAEDTVENGVEDVFYYWLEENNYTIDDYFKLHIKYWTDEIERTLSHLESKGIKTKILHWTNDYLESMESKPFFQNRTINLKYDDVVYKSISDLQNKFPSKFIISHDIDGFNGKKPSESVHDFHPSKFCHEIIAKNIIEEIEKEHKKPLI